jgi:hypothetical protein
MQQHTTGQYRALTPTPGGGRLSAGGSSVKRLSPEMGCTLGGRYLVACAYMYNMLDLSQAAGSQVLTGMRPWVQESRTTRQQTTTRAPGLRAIHVYRVNIMGCLTGEKHEGTDKTAQWSLHSIVVLSVAKLGDPRIVCTNVSPSSESLPFCECRESTG